MKKVLIYMTKETLSPIGGPKGYNYNLLQGLSELQPDENDNIEIIFLESSPSIADDINRKINKLRKGKQNSFIRVVKSILKKGLMMYGPRHKTAINLEKYDAVHFHSTMHLYEVKSSLKSYNGKILLTSHTPTMPCYERFSVLSDFEKKYMKWFYKKLLEIDKIAFDRADYITFPCPEAEEPYYHTWKGYDDFYKKNHQKFLYYPTGTSEMVALTDRQSLRDKYHIPHEAFLISYVGRHNEIKGYGDLKEIGKQILRKHSNLYFLIAGREEPMYGLPDSRWIEVGWTNDPGSIINASDMFILPNRETYFDLIMLEVLSLGQIILASETGGNKYFRKFDNSGIFFFDGIENAVCKVDEIIIMSAEDKRVIREKNKEIFAQNFTSKIFAQNYINTISRII